MSLNSIDIGLHDLLRDPQRRNEFFKAITQDEIASQIRDLRKKRSLTQIAFARLAEMKQSAVSRIEQAEYSSWTLTTLFRVAAALDARWRITLEPAEDAIAELERLQLEQEKETQGQAAKNFLDEQNAISNPASSDEPFKREIALRDHFSRRWKSGDSQREVMHRVNEHVAQ